MKNEMILVLIWIVSFGINISVAFYKNGIDKKIFLESDTYAILLAGPFAFIGWILGGGGSDTDAGGI